MKKHFFRKFKTQDVLHFTNPCQEYQDSKSVPCVNGYAYSETERWWHSANTEFNLVCERKLYSTLSESLFFAGFLIGAVAGGWLADSYGRIRGCAIGGILCTLSTLATSYSTNWLYFALFRFGCGIFANVQFIAIFVYAMEVTGPDVRSIVGLSIQAVFAIGYGLLSLLAYIFPYWRDLELSITVLTAPMCLLMIFIPESPRYSIVKGKTEEAEQSLLRIARGNGVDLDGLKLDSKLMKSLSNEQSKNQYTGIDLFRQGKPMALITINCMFNWFVNSTTYYGLTLNAAALPTSLYVSNLVGALGEILGVIIAINTVDRPTFGRKKVLITFLLTAGVCTLLSTIFSEFGYCDKDADDRFSNPWILLSFILAQIGKVSISGSFAVIYNVTAELFPTQVRANAVGICSMISRLGGILAPVFLSLYELVTWLPGVIFGSFAIVAGVLSFYFPETYGVPMLMSFEEANMLYKKEANRKKIQDGEINDGIEL